MSDTRIAELMLFATERVLTAGEMGELADLHKEWEIKRLALDKQSTAAKAHETAAEQLLVAQMLKQEVTAAGGHDYTATLKKKFKPTVRDWGAFNRYILENQDLSLLQKRPSEAAVAERWEAGEIVPGVEKFPVYSLSMSKVTSGA